MTTSNSYSVQYTRDQLSTAALRKLGVLAAGQIPTPGNLSDAAEAFNMLISMMRAKGMPMWARTTYSFIPTSTVSSYNIGTGQTLNTPYPLKLLQVYRTTDGTRIDMDIDADFNFNQLPPGSSGIPIKVTYQALNNYGVVQLWPTPDTSTATTTITMVYQRPFQYFTSSTNTMDFPEEWYVPLVYQLAVLLAPEWGIPLQDRQALKMEAKEYLDEVLGMGSEDASMFIQPYRQGPREGLS
jgi:hypothetical protein